MSAAHAAPWLSVIIPVRDDAAPLARLLAEFEPLLAAEAPLEIIVVDGGSQEPPAPRPLPGLSLISASAPGRGRQLAKGAAAARGEWLWLLHADTSAVAGAFGFLSELREPAWGRFDVAFAAASSELSWGLKAVAWMMNWRSRLSGICTGDQGMFLHRALYEQLGGIPAQPLMEDVELSKRLKRIAAPLCPNVCIVTSPRRWATHGLVRTVLSMWRFRLRYWLGADPTKLAAEYYRER